MWCFHQIFSVIFKNMGEILTETITTIPFTKEMRTKTKEIHDISDALVNAKLGLALSDDAVWVEGLTIFYEVFHYLENAMTRLKDTPIGKLDIPGMRRVPAFEEDLEFYQGKNWFKKYKVRESVKNYISHLRELEKNNPTMLMAYVYHLYMGLFAGGQILHRKRSLARKFSFSKSTDDNAGMAITSFGSIKIGSLKNALRDAMNIVALELDEKTRSDLIEESKRVFELNNEIIRSVKGIDGVIWRKVFFTVGVAACLFYAWKYSRDAWNSYVPDGAN